MKYYYIYSLNNKNNKSREVFVVVFHSYSSLSTSGKTDNTRSHNTSITRNIDLGISVTEGVSNIWHISLIPFTYHLLSLILSLISQSIRFTFFLKMGIRKEMEHFAPSPYNKIIQFLGFRFQNHFF